MLTQLPIDKIVRWFAYVAICCALLFILFAAKSCNNAKKIDQLKQTLKVGEAAVQAGQNAVETVNERSAVESQIDASVSTGQQQVTNAKSTDEVYDAVRDVMCDRLRVNGGNDPACRVR